MRPGEIQLLKWSYIEREKGYVYLPAKITKEKKPKTIPINHNIDKLLRLMPRVLHHDYAITFILVGTNYQLHYRSIEINTS